MNYTNENRGIIQNRERSRQIIDFRGIKYDNITPSDIDGCIDKRGKAFIFYEYKLNDAEMPQGQKMMYVNLINSLRAANKKAALFLCKHNVENPSEDIDAAQAKVESVYYDGQWWKVSTGRNVKEVTDSFMAKFGQ